MQRAAAVGADLGGERRRVVAQPVGAQAGLRVEGAEVAAHERSGARFGQARMAARAVGGEHVVAARDRAVAEAPFEVGNQVAVVVARVGLHGLAFVLARFAQVGGVGPARSEEHTSELQSLMRISYAVFCLKKKNQTKQ